MTAGRGWRGFEPLSGWEHPDGWAQPPARACGRWSVSGHGRARNVVVGQWKSVGSRETTGDFETGASAMVPDPIIDTAHHPPLLTTQ